MTEHLLIDGKRIPAEAGRTFDRLDPVLGTFATRAAAMSRADARAAVAAAPGASGAWSRNGPETRPALLSAGSDAMHARATDFADAMMRQTGAPRDHVTPGMRIRTEESFGPMNSVIRVPDEAAAIACGKAARAGSDRQTRRPGLTARRSGPNPASRDHLSLLAKRVPAGPPLSSDFDQSRLTPMYSTTFLATKIEE